MAQTNFNMQQSYGSPPKQATHPKESEIFAIFFFWKSHFVAKIARKNEHITELPLQESDRVPTVKLQYNHRGLPCGQDYPHVDRRLRSLVVFRQLVHNGSKD